MTQYDEWLQNAINAETLDDNAKSGMWSAYVDGKLYRNQKGKSTWNQKGHLTNSIRNQSSIARNLRLKLEWEYQQKYPEQFKKSSYWPYRLEPIDNGHRQVFEKVVEFQFDQWFREHVKYVSGYQEFRENVLKVVAGYIQETEKNLKDSEPGYEDGNEDDVARLHYWDGAHDISLAIERDIKAI